MLPGELLLIADDLTGACDAAVPFAARGAATVVWLRGVPGPGTAAVTAVSTDSRDREEAEAAAAIRALAGFGARVVFKKIDSVLRGRPGFEIAEALEVFGLRRPVVTPAFPALGRRVIGGLLHVEGIEETVCAESRLGMPVLDAATEEELDAIVATALSAGDPVLWAGSGGLALALARAMCGEPVPAERPRATRVLFGIGSNHPVTCAQRGELARLRPEAQVFWIQRGRRVAPPLEPEMALFLCGGDTASAVLAELGAEAIELRGEIVPGVPWGYIRGGDGDGRAVATKSGGFGPPDTLVRVADWFAGLG